MMRMQGCHLCPRRFQPAYASPFCPFMGVWGLCPHVHPRPLTFFRYPFYPPQWGMGRSPMFPLALCPFPSPFPYFSIAAKSARAAGLPARIEHPLSSVMGLPSICVQAPPASEMMMLAAA